MPRRILLFGFFLLLPLSLRASGVNTDITLPLKRGEGIFRTQVSYSRDTNDPLNSGRSRHRFKFPLVAGYSPAEKVAVFAIMPVIRQDFPQEATGLGDIALLGRQRILEKPSGTKITFIDFFTGIEIPSKDDPFSSNSWDIPVGLVTGIRSSRQGLTLDWEYQFNTTGAGIDQANDFIYNAVFEYGFNPLNVLLELNGEWSGQDKQAGVPLADTGGHTLFLSPGLQFGLGRWTVEGSFQYPLVQNLNGNQLRTVYRVVGGVRAIF